MKAALAPALLSPLRCHLSSTPTPLTQDVDEALKRLPQDVVDARNQRLKRAHDLNMKHSELPADLQQLQTPYQFYVKDTLEVGVGVRVGGWGCWGSGLKGGGRGPRTQAHAPPFGLAASGQSCTPLPSSLTALLRNHPAPLSVTALPLPTVAAAAGEAGERRASGPGHWKAVRAAVALNLAWTKRAWRPA